MLPENHQQGLHSSFLLLFLTCWGPSLFPPAWIPARPSVLWVTCHAFAQAVSPPTPLLKLWHPPTLLPSYQIPSISQPQSNFHFLSGKPSGAPLATSRLFLFSLIFGTTFLYLIILCGHLPYGVIFLKVDFLFQSSFRFIAKLIRQNRDLPYTPTLLTHTRPPSFLTSLTRVAHLLH